MRKSMRLISPVVAAALVVGLATLGIAGVGDDGSVEPTEPLRVRTADPEPAPRGAGGESTPEGVNRQPVAEESEPAVVPALERAPAAADATHPQAQPQPSAAVAPAAEPAPPAASSCGPSTATGPVPAGTSAPVAAAPPAEQPSTVQGVDEGNVEPVAPTCQR